MTIDTENSITSSFIKRSLEERLNQVDYSFINSDEYHPSVFALNFLNFVKLVNDGKGEGNVSPAFHLEMLDKIGYGSKWIANLCHRGSGKTTMFAEYLIPYLAIFNCLPKIDNITGIIYVGDTMENGVKSLRKNIEFRYRNSEFLQKYLPHAKFTDANIVFTNLDGISTGIRLMGAKTGIRGIKIFGKRPQFAILDDLVSDEDARSKVALDAINNTIYNCVMPALDPNIGKSGVIANGTPFNKQDPLVTMIESGEWDANVYPICNQFPCAKEDFIGSWEDRFSYDFVMGQYKLMQSTGKLNAFYQEYMLRITPEEDRLVAEGEILWYDRFELLAKRHEYNYYITTDFATSAKHTADYSVISVWAVDSAGNWLWVDGSVFRKTIDVVIDRLFELCILYNPLGVGIEASGQQGGLISMIRREMLNRSVWFNIIKDGATDGIRPKGDKLSRFNAVLPLFKMGKIKFPEQLKNDFIMLEFVDELRLATGHGLKGRDDCLDTISMLNYITPAIPYGNKATQQRSPIFDNESDYRLGSIDDFII